MLVFVNLTRFFLKLHRHVKEIILTQSGEGIERTQTPLDPTLVENHVSCDTIKLSIIYICMHFISRYICPIKILGFKCFQLFLLELHILMSEYPLLCVKNISELTHNLSVTSQTILIQ